MSNVSNQVQNLSAEQKRAMLAKLLQEKAKKTAEGQCIHRWFEQRVAQTPEAVAVVAGDHQFTYRQLNQQANQLAHYLQTLGVEPESFVGVCMNPAWETVVTVLAILKAGAAYVPLESHLIPEQINFILKDIQASVIITQEHYQAYFSAYPTICIEKDWQEISKYSESDYISTIAAQNLAAVIYTGKLGVAVEHYSWYQRIDWLQQKWQLSVSDAVLYKSPLTTASAIWEIFWPLVTGGRVIVATTTDNPASFTELIAAHQISWAHFVPSELGLWLKSLTATSNQDLRSLRGIICSGEPLSQTLVEQFNQQLDCELYYVWSLPETGGEITWQLCQSGNERNFQPVGRPPNKSVYILDQSQKLLPIGLIGEVCVAGAGLARGYFHAIIQTSQTFITNLFTENTRLYKTGELGRLLDDGSLELTGFRQRQAWIRGFRIDLPIIESTLLTSPIVEDCRVIARTSIAGVSELVAYVVLSSPSSPAQLQVYLQNLLPAYLLPHAYVSVTALPLTATRQIDEAALTRLTVIDSELVQKWEEKLRLLPAVEQVAVVTPEQSKISPPLHLWDLLAECKTITRDEPITVPTSESEIVSQPQSKKLAISDGGKLHITADTPTTLPQILQYSALGMAIQGITYIQPDGTDSFQSYPSLLADAERILAGLRRYGLKPQDKVIFQLEQNQDFIPAFWGCVLGGFVPVPVAVAPSYEQSNSAIAKLQNAWQMLDQPLVLASDKIVSPLSNLTQALNLENFQVASIAQLRQPEPDHNWHPSQPEDVALIMLTSGSTGMPKGVLLKHRNLLSRTIGSIQINDFSSADITLNWMPLDHVAGIIYFHIRDVYLGCQQIHAPIELVLQNPLKWLDWIEQFQVTVTFAPNFAFGLINDKATTIKQQHWDLSSIRYVLNGGEAIVAKTARQFLELLTPHGLPATAMFPAWGMAEVSSGVTYSHNFGLDSTSNDDSFVQVGVPIPGVCLRIIDHRNQVVEEETIGHLQISGLTLTSGYYGNPELNKGAFTEDGWFITGDLGFLRKGCLTITGRAKDIIIINGNNYYSHEIEGAVEELENIEVSYTAAVAVRQLDNNTDNLVIFFSPVVADDTEILKTFKAIRSHVIQKIGVNPDYLVPVAKEVIPKTSIGKIQRSQLSKSFATGEFNEIVKKFDILMGNSNTLPNWFYQKVWQHKQASNIASVMPTGTTLIFVDGLGLGEWISTQLEQQQIPCIQVAIASEFAKIATNKYSISPNNPDHYRLLLESLAQKVHKISQILHLWTYNNYTEIASLADLAAAQAIATNSLLFLVQALAQVQDSSQPVQLQVISSYVQGISPDDPIAFAKSPMLGLVKTIPQEMPWLSCRHLDLPITPVATNGAYILSELLTATKAREVAYRDGKRLIARLAPADFSHAAKQSLPFKIGGMYLLTGGLGDIGLELAQYLLQTYQAQLLLIGRTPLSQIKESAKLAAYKSLSQLGGKVEYHAVDVCDLAQLQQIVSQAESQWSCQLDGIIHLAAVYQEHLLTEETSDSFAATLKPKVIGTWVLHQLLQNKPSSLFISFSSVASFFGGAMVGAYTAANNFLESFCQSQRSQTALQSYCFAWGSWEGLGISRNSQMNKLTQARGYSVISAKQALYSLLAGLHHNQPHLFIGLDGNNPNIRRFVDTDVTNVQYLSAYMTAKEQLAIAEMQSIEICDRFQTKSSCDFIHLETLPLTDTGEIDQAQLIALASQAQHLSQTKVAPRTAVEAQIVEIWQEILGVPQVGIYDNFFELGGNSLVAVQLISRLQANFKVELALSNLLTAQTVADLAALLEQPTANFASPLVAIQPQGEQTPYFFIHPIGGNIICYGELARHLGNQQPVYGLQSPGLSGNSQPLKNIAEMATSYISAIQTIQPQGPYYLGGWSLGGIIAWEMAQQLQAAGQEVAQLVLIDSYAAPMLNIPQNQDRATLIATALEDLGKIAGKKVTCAIAHMQQLSLDEQLKYVRAQAQQANLIPADCSLEQIRQILEVFQANHEAWYAYAPQSYVGNVTLFSASEQIPQAKQDAVQYWSKMVTGRVNAYNIPGNHYTILQPPQVQILSEKLK
ncbi:SDR family NAD(P)-dependent oxidoreductase [Nostoc sp. UHCC 0702]|nr:SDR family NAD(P)-dependent oxidoreductase [Nostoc sp. UHCC 0702]